MTFLRLFGDKSSFLNIDFWEVELVSWTIVVRTFAPNVCQNNEMQINTDLSGCGIKLAVLQFQRSLTKIIVWSCRNRVQDKQCSPYLTGFLLWDDPCPCPSQLFQGGDGIFLLIRRPAAKHSHILTRVYVVDSSAKTRESAAFLSFATPPHTDVMCTPRSPKKDPDSQTAEK